MAESYVFAASRYAGSSEAGFLGAHAEVLRAVRHLDMPSAEAASRLHALHVRHGQAVTAVLSRQVGVITDWVRTRLTLPDSSLLGMVLGPQSHAIVQRDPAEVEQPAAAQAASRPNPTITRPISFGVAASGDKVVFADGPVLHGRSANLVWELLPAFNAGQAAARGPDGHLFVRTEQLAAELGIVKNTLHQRVRRLRSELAAQFLDQTGSVIADDDVVQNWAWNGYRLNPHLLALVGVE